MTVYDANDEYFPRGGKGGEIKKKRNFVFEKKSLFGEKAKKPGRRERKRKGLKTRVEETSDSDSEVVFHRFEPLVYKGLSEGTLALCSVREVHDKYADISMPGRLSARLYIENVSEPYYNVLKQKSSGDEVQENEVSPLSSMFRIGQHINCSVLSVKNDSHYIVRVTSDPAQVNSYLTFDSVKTGSVIQMAVQSVEDHGYMMFSGISGLISFLPRVNAVSYVNDICNFKPLAIGQVVWCCVTKTKLTGNSNTVQVTLDFENIEKSKLLDNISIPLLNPGVQVNVTVNKVISQNLLVTINGSDIQGYVEESQLGSMWSKTEDYRIGSVHSATVLYKFPYAKIVALTFKSNPTTISKEEIKHGTIFENAEVMSIMKRGVCLRLSHNGKNYKGMISVRRLGDNVNYLSMSANFPLGNHLKCRVIGYDALEQVYSCTVDDKLLNEKFLSHTDLQVGQMVDVKVESIKKSGAEVSVGAVRGYVPALHVCDVVIQNPLEKLTLNSKHKAKVLRLEENNIIFTLRPTLVKNRSLTNFQQVLVGDSFYGSVNKILPSAITVSFFNGLYAHIKEQDLLEHPHKYTVGELVKCFVLETHYGKPPKFSLLKSVQNMALTVGETYPLVVKKIEKNGLTCFFMSKGQHFNGYIPLSHFCDHLEFCKDEMKKYTHGSVISNAVLLSINEKLPLFTLKQSVIDLFKINPDLKQGFNSLQKQMLLPCSVSEVLLDRLLVCAPIPGFNGKIPIMMENLPKTTKKYYPYQGLVPSVSDVLISAREVVLTCRLDDEQKIQWSVYNLENFLTFMKPMQKYHIGSKLECKVNSVNGNTLNVSLKSPELKGLIRTNIADHGHKPGDTVVGVVAYQDVKNNTIHMYLECSKNTLSKSLKLKKHKEVKGTVLHVNNYFITAVLEGSKVSGNIVLLPMHKDPNNFNTTLAVKDVPIFSSCSIKLVSPLGPELWEESSEPFWIGITHSFTKKDDRKRKASDSVQSETCNIEASGLEESTVNNEIEIPKKKKKKASQGLDSLSESNISTDLNPDCSIETLEDSIERKVKKKTAKNVLSSLPDNSLSSDVLNSDMHVENLEDNTKKKKKKQLTDDISEADKNLCNKKVKLSSNENDNLVISQNCLNDNELGADTSQTECSSTLENNLDTSSKKIKKKKKKNKAQNEDVDAYLLTPSETESPLVESSPVGKGSGTGPILKKSDTKKKNILHKSEDSSLKSQINSPKSKESSAVGCNTKKRGSKGTNVDSSQETESKKKKKEKPTTEETSISLEDVGGFEWDVSLSDLTKVTSSAAIEEDDLSQDSDEETAPAKKLTPAEKRAAAFEAERLIREKEEELLVAESNPQSAEHFDRLVTASPNSSKLWIMYMAYHMQATEIEKARSVAKRALKHINVRLEDERLNIWIASLNLENMYGTPDSFKEVLNEALKYNDDYKVYKNILTIYADSNKVTELEKLVNQMVKKFKDKVDCWIECQTALMKAGLYEKARNYLQRSLEALPTKDYCTLVSRFALLENKHGFHDQAHSLFENLLTSYPKRVDLWSVYVDMLSKSGAPDLARNVLERATSQKLPVRKMKGLYQKWMKFEEAYGGPKRVEEVKEMAKKYVDNLTSSLKDVN